MTSFSKLTNTIQGDLQSTGIPTNMALNGEGYFIVQERSGTANNRPVFGGTDLFTRRGDFAMDKDGFLVNGSAITSKARRIADPHRSSRPPPRRRRPPCAWTIRAGS